MMASRAVHVWCDSRSKTIDVTPGMLAIEIVQEACRLFKTTHTNYGLRLKNTTTELDLASTYRSLNLGQGQIKLEIYAISSSPLPVAITLRAPESLGAGEQLERQFPSDTTLWKILRHFEEASAVNITKRDDLPSGKISGPGRIFHEEPVLKLSNNRVISGLEQLDRTLAQYGMARGRYQLVLSFRQTPVPLEEALANQADFFRESQDDNVALSSRTPIEGPPSIANGGIALVQVELSKDAPRPDGKVDPAGQPANAPEDLLGLDGNVESTDREKKGADLQEGSKITKSNPSAQSSTQQQMTNGANVASKPLSITVYAPASSGTPKAASLPHNEKDYEPTAQHATSVLGRLQTSGRNTRLPSDAEIEQIEKEKAQKAAAVTTIKIKVRYPDSYVVDFVCTADITANDFYQMVSDSLIDGSRPFKLRGLWKKSGPQSDIPHSNLTLSPKLGFENKSTLHILLLDRVTDEDRNGPMLKPQYAAIAKDLIVPVIQEDEPSKDVKKSDTDQDKKRKGGGGGLMGKAFPGLKGRKI